MEEGVDEGGVRIVQVGSKASAVGRVDLWFDRTTRTVVRLEARAIDLVEEIPETWRDARIEELCARLVETTEASMAEVVGELARPLTRAKQPIGSSAAGNLVADLFRARTGADLALMNRGGIRCDLPAGPVTRRAVFEFLPFDNHLVTLDLSGAELFEVLRRAVEGEAHSGVELSGGRLVVSGGDGRPARLVGVRVGAAELDPAVRYRVTVNSFMAGGGDDYVDAAVGGERREDPILMRDVLEEALRAQGTLTCDAGDRYEVVAR
jgi:5'-nucleotidase